MQNGGRSALHKREVMEALRNEEKTSSIGTGNFSLRVDMDERSLGL